MGGLKRGRPFVRLSIPGWLPKSMYLLSFAPSLRRGTVNYLSFLPVLWCVRFPRCEDEWQRQALLRFP